MPRPDRSREALVATMARLLQRQGYAATGLKQVVTESGTAPGSLYHHFPGGKEELAAAALGVSGGQVADLLGAVLAGDAPTPEVVRGWVLAMADLLARSDWLDGCPVAPAALEAVAAGPRLRAAAADQFRTWHALLAGRLERDGLAPDEASAAAHVVLSAMEGALLLARTSGDVAPLRAVADAAPALLAGRSGRSGT